MASLPSGRHGLSPEYVASHQRARLVRAVGELCAERGYPWVTNSDVARAAGVSPRTFYRHFSSKEDCFQAAFAEAVEQVEATVTAAINTGAHWPRRAGAGLKALLEELSVHPTLASTLFVDVLFAGQGALRMREQVLARARVGLPVPKHAPPQVAEAAVGGVVESIYHIALERHTDQLPAMWGELLYCLLMPLLGHEGALASCEPG